MNPEFALNSSKRLPIVFVLDVSVSMKRKNKDGGASSIELLNKSVASFIEELKSNQKIRACAEISFITFAGRIIDNTKFTTVNKIEAPVFETVQGLTKTGGAVLEAIDKITNRIEAYENNRIPYYAPFLVIITDGNPDENDDPVISRRAVEAVNSHCRSRSGAKNIIVPFVIGIGEEVNAKALTEYSSGFTNGFFHIKGDSAVVATKFNKVFRLIGNSVSKSVDLNSANSIDVVEPLRVVMNDVIEDLNNT